MWVLNRVGRDAQPTTLQAFFISEQILCFSACMEQLGMRVR